MGNKYITDQEFKRIVFTSADTEKTDYENCKFLDCNFANSNLNGFQFEDCTFEQCDLSNASVNQTAFRNIRFKNCKLIGVQFDTCHPFLLSFQFHQSILNFVSFYKLKIPATLFHDCTIIEADFSESVLSDAVFKNCNLSGTTFGNTDLSNADFLTSFDFIIDPERNKITGAHFSLQNLPGLLMKYNIIID